MKGKWETVKILFVMPREISFGGIETVAVNLWKGLTKEGHQVDFVCHGNLVGIRENEIIECGSKVFHIPVKGKNFYGTVKQFENIMEDEKYDVVHAHMNATSGIYLKIAMQHGVSIRVAHSHAASVKAITKNPVKMIINELEKYNTNSFSNVKIACSSNAGKWLFGNNQFSLILNAVDTEHFVFSKSVRKQKRREIGIQDDVFVVGHIGAFLPVKNHDYLLRVFAEMLKYDSSVKLMLIGDGPLKNRIRAKAKKMKIDESILWMGERKDVSELLQVMDVFVLPSHSEGNPVSVAEAAATGLHCIISNKISADTGKVLGEDAIEYLAIDDSNIPQWARNAGQVRDRVSCYERQHKQLSLDIMLQKVMKLYSKPNDK